MQALIELIAGFIALLATAALSQFGVTMHAPPQQDREVHRIADCRDAPANATTVSVSSRRC